MPVRSVHFQGALVLVPARDLLAKLAALKRDGFPDSPYDIQSDLNEVNALGGVPGTLHEPWQAGADWSLLVYTRRYAVRLFKTKRGDAYTIASVVPLRLTHHQQLAHACLLLRPSGWQIATTNHDIPQGTDSGWHLVTTGWNGLLASLTVTVAPGGRQAAFLDTLDRVIDATKRITVSDEGGPLYAYRQVTPTAGARVGRTQQYEFTLAGARPLEAGTFVQVASVAADSQGVRSVSRGRVIRTSGMTATIMFDEPVNWTDLKGQGEITVAANDFVYRQEHAAVARLRSGHASNPGGLAALVEGRAALPHGGPQAERPARQLNPGQDEAFRKALARPDLLAVIGPPGTGKTRTITEIARAVAGRGERVLVCSQSNRAVDNVLPRLPRDLLAIRVGSDAVTPEGLPYLLQRQAADLREQALNIARRNLDAYRQLADADAWSSELTRACNALAGIRADLAQAEARYEDACRAAGGPATGEVDRIAKIVAALAEGAGHSTAKAERLRRSSISGLALLARRRARKSDAEGNKAAVLVKALRDAEANLAAAWEYLAEMTKDVPSVLEAAAQARALFEQAEKEHAAALQAAGAMTSPCDARGCSTLLTCSSGRVSR